jgi:hypothetical protein
MEEAFQVLNDEICKVAVKADVERKILLQHNFPRAAHSIGALMRLIWKLSRCCNRLHEDNVKLRKESMELKAVKRAMAHKKFGPVAKERLN